MGDVIEFTLPPIVTLSTDDPIFESDTSSINLGGGIWDQSDCITLTLAGEKVFSISYIDGIFIVDGDPVKGAEVFVDSIAATLNLQGWTK
jgi:hypothetical protein